MLHDPAAFPDPYSEIPPDAAVPSMKSVVPRSVLRQVGTSDPPAISLCHASGSIEPLSNRQGSLSSPKGINMR